MSTTGREEIGDYSKGNRGSGRRDRRLQALAGLLGGLGLAGAVLAIVATFTTIIRIQVLTVTPAQFTGYERHSVALILLGVFGLVMVAGAVRGARPAMAALGLTGVAVLLIAVILDLPHLNDSGVWPQADQYEDAQASAGIGYYFETASGVLMMLAGASLLLLTPRRDERPSRRRRARSGIRRERATTDA